MWCFERDAAKEERRRHSRALQCRDCVPDVAGEIVVERDRDRKFLPAPATPHGVHELSGGNHSIVAPEMTDLPRKHIAGDRSEDLEVWVSAVAADAVVDEHRPGASRRQAGEPAHENRENRSAHIPGARHVNVVGD